MDSPSIHPLFYHIAHGVDHFFNKLNLGVHRYDAMLERQKPKAIDGEDLNQVVDLLKEQMASLKKAVKKLEAPDHSCILKFGGLTFTCPDDIQTWLKEIHAEEPLPVSFWGHVYDL